MIASLLIELGWKSSLVCGVALLASLALHGRPAAQRVAMLRAGIAALLLLPLLILTVPALEIAALPASAPLPALPVGEVGSVPISADTASGLEVDWLAVAYAAGAAFLVLRLGLGLAMLSRWARLAAPASQPAWLEAIARAAQSLRRPVRLLVSPRVASPLSLGIAPATILIGPDTERRADRAEAVIAHEMAHVRRFDWPVMLASRIALAMFWFNPLAWLLAAALARETELAADEEAVRHVAPADYAQTLLAVAGSCGAHSACGMAVTRSALARRIGRVLDTAPRRPASGLLCAILIGGLPLGVAPLAAMQVVEAPPAPPAAPVPVPPPVAPAPRVVPAPVPLAQDAPEPPVRPRIRVKRAPAAPPPAAAPPAVVAVQKPAAPPRPPAPARPPAPPIFGESDTVKWRRPFPPIGPDGRSPWTKKAPDVLQQIEQRLAAAKSLRDASEQYRRQAQDKSLSAEIRNGYRNVSDSLRDEADKLEGQARALKRGV